MSSVIPAPAPLTGSDDLGDDVKVSLHVFVAQVLQRRNIAD